MFAQFGAILATVQSVVDKILGNRIRAVVGMAAAALSLGGCIPTVPLVGADPADPNVPVAAVGYRSTVAPYTSLRPAIPKAWREQNERATPAPKSDQ